MNNHTWNRFSCLLNAPVDSSLDAIRHWQYVHAERRRVDELLSATLDDSDQFDGLDTLTDDQEARIEELYRHLEDVYKTYKQGDHSKFASPDIPQLPTWVHPPVPSHIKTAFKEWRQQCWSMSEKFELIKQLPRPPFIACLRVGCDNTLGPLKTCVHTLERLYRSAELCHKELIKERNFWHPDRWSRVPQPYRQEVERMAILLFQVLQPLCDEVG
ncbi:unnamed protein product [Aureobasidium mustum]|uniref:Uncharacterized protein n=1 Tax=Aureobasidium mustum TaxID=2773714 RepID=A0A9N8K4V0_9PEZI|nr:unnamed protein product [Aureobasidium mustum]